MSAQIVDAAQEDTHVLYEIDWSGSFADQNKNLCVCDFTDFSKANL
jgi:hypothetical protein